MNHVRIGRSRKPTDKDKRIKRGDVWAAFGVLALAGMLILPLSSGDKTVESQPPNAVAVMKLEAETLEEPRRSATTEEWSVFDEIGSFFASLIFGN